MHFLTEKIDKHFFKLSMHYDTHIMPVIFVTTAKYLFELDLLLFILFDHNFCNSHVDDFFKRSVICNKFSRYSFIMTSTVSLISISLLSLLSFWFLFLSICFVVYNVFSIFVNDIISIFESH